MLSIKCVEELMPLGLKSKLCELFDESMLEFKLLIGFRLKLVPGCSSEELYPLWLDIKLENLCCEKNNNVIKKAPI